MRYLVKIDLYFIVPHFAEGSTIVDIDEDVQVLDRDFRSDRYRQSVRRAPS